MEWWFKGFTLCFLFQMLLRMCSSVETMDSVEIMLRKKAEKKSDEEKSDPEYEAEKKAGSTADLFGANQHYSYPTLYKDFGRRFVPVYPYSEKVKNNGNGELLPIKASPEKVLSVAMDSALEQALHPINNSEVVMTEKEILRTGDYWNAVWVEDVPKSVLRSYSRNHLAKDQKKKKVDRSSAISKLGSVRAKIMPGSDLYQLVSVLQQYSPRLLYVINNRNK